MPTPEELCTECLEALNEAENQLSEAKDYAQSACSNV